MVTPIPAKAIVITRTRLSRKFYKALILTKLALKKMVPLIGFELTTYALQIIFVNAFRVTAH